MGIWPISDDGSTLYDERALSKLRDIKTLDRDGVDVGSEVVIAKMEAAGGYHPLLPNRHHFGARQRPRTRETSHRNVTNTPTNNLLRLTLSLLSRCAGSHPEITAICGNC
jgi:hypothetical protein